MILIMDLCEEVVQSPGKWVYKKLWEQDRLDLEGSRVAASAEVEGEP